MENMISTVVKRWKLDTHFHITVSSLLQDKIPKITPTKKLKNDIGLRDRVQQ